MKNINEMTENEILEKIARITELTPVLEEKKAKISEEDDKRWAKAGRGRCRHWRR